MAPVLSPICPMAYWKLPARSNTCTRKFIASTTIRFWPSSRSSVGKLNSPSPSPLFADGLQHVALHVEDENLVAQRIGHIDPLRGGVHGDSGGPLEITFAALQAADGAQILSAGLEDEDLAGLRVGDIDIVLGIDGDALRRAHGVLAFPRR